MLTKNPNNNENFRLIQYGKDNSCKIKLML